jgi:hypothetical protein
LLELEKISGAERNEWSWKEWMEWEGIDVEEVCKWKELLEVERMIGSGRNCWKWKDWTDGDPPDDVDENVVVAVDDYEGDLKETLWNSSAAKLHFVQEVLFDGLTM